MKKNIASQVIGAQMITAADGSAFTGSVTVYVTGDGGTQAVGSVGSGLCAHEGNGYHTYTPAQAETNYDLVAFTFIGTGAINSTIQCYTDYPQSADHAANIAAILTDTGTDIPATLATIAGYIDTEIASIISALAVAQADLDIITGAAGVTLDLPVGAVPALGIADNGTAQSASATGVVLRAAAAFDDNVLIGAVIAVYGSTQGYWQYKIITGNTLSTDEVVVDAFTVTPTGTITYIIYGSPAGSSTLLPSVDVQQIGGSSQSAADLKDFADEGYDPATNKVQGVVLTDTVTTYTGNTPQTADHAASIAAILADTGTDLPATLAAIAGYIDTEVAAILIDTGTTLPAQITALQAKLLAYTQLLARSDAAIATDNASELAEINANGGSGAGAFDNTTDAEQAIADSGGGGPTAVQIRQEIDSNSTQLAAIIADTGTDLPATLAAIAGYLDTEIAAILLDTGTTLPAQIAALEAALSAAISAIMTTQMTESYAADGVAPTPTQALMLTQQLLSEFARTGTSVVVNRLDGVTPAATLTLDSASAPTSSTRAS